MSGLSLVYRRNRHLADPVVEFSRRLVEGLGHPINRGAAFRIRRGIDRLDQLAADAGAAHFGVGIEVLQVADVFDPPAVAMEEVVRQSRRPAVHLGDQPTKFVVAAAEEPGEGGTVDLLQNCRLVEGEIAGPEPAPFGFVRRAEGADGDGAHARPSFGSSCRHRHPLSSGAQASKQCTKLSAAR